MVWEIFKSSTVNFMMQPWMETWLHFYIASVAGTKSGGTPWMQVWMI
ncbi:hypothetical protein CBFG_04087 [Clostridiales bacterium 1_7_47FAA]|nr:hypothetical protein CBFG_04087 [Clostridiales bacterium 1_7_47FAA]